MGLLASCQNNDCLKSAGEETTERRELPEFQDITINDNVSVTLVQDSETYAEVRTGKNLQEDLKLEVRGSRLYLTNESRCNWGRSYDIAYEVTLHLPRINDVDHLGQGTIRTQGQFRVDTAYFHMTGTGDYDLDLRSNYLWLDQYELGDYRLRGTTDQLLLTGGGLGRFFATELRARACYLNLSIYADNDVYVNASEYVQGTHAGGGSIYYAGNPTTADVRVTGKGKVIKQN
ncbi:DUF2807 domain-containing protein [Microvirga sp. STR05]|uniref:DUF2807 domain-containing protein n=1 Tax=Hymenobacter duratus TaxID=2771356 RepID=A0ABR8JHH4_9BACT|nr:DUF2807 domain-containing protein [Hymenobacter duratus]MBD2715053.1 DUF2807 domain-containing protein [Hymenobacter duratus]MBR7949959.1 DUF2807 domain-containing protein [Microvirga sp. STR05]